MAGWRRSPLLRPVRKFRRWMRHTPNGDVARTLTLVGVSVAFIAGAFAFYMF